METKITLVKLIESYVDSSTSPPQQAASVNSIATLLKNDTITMEFLVKEMEMYLTTTDHILRARGMLLLAEVLGNLQSKPFDSTTIHTLVVFFKERLADWRALRGALVGCLALVRRKTGAVTGVDAKLMAQSFLENLQVQSLGQHDRKLCFELLELLIDRYRESISSLGDHVVYGVCEAIEGEKDPQCLMHVFHIVEGLAKTFPDPSGPVASFAEDLFDIIGCYFPIHYTHAKDEDVDVSRDDLSRALMMAFSASPFFEPFAIPLLLEKLSSNLPLAKMDSLKYLSYCIVKYGPERALKHTEAIWSSLKTSIWYFPIKDVDLTNSMLFEENEITKEALNLLQKIASQQSNVIVNLVLGDKDIKGLLNLFTNSASSGCALSQNEQKLHFLGRLLFVFVKACTSSCNKVFSDLFLQFLDSLGVMVNTSKDVLVKDSAYQRLNSCVLYLCIEVLGACKELAVSSVQISSNSDFINDSWCQMVSAYSCSLTKALISDLAPRENKVNDDSDLSLRVKGLEILGTFPGESTPMSNSTFELILDALVSVVINSFDMAALWKVSLNALAEIGKFLNEYSYSEKFQSYMSIVVEKMVSLIALVDHRMPYSLLLEALSNISASGHKCVSRVVEGVQEAISVKMTKVYVDGDVKVCEELVQLLDCYSVKLLPWFQTYKGSESVPLRLAMDIWDQTEAAMTSSFITEGKVQQLLDATKRVLKLAVAMLLEEDQRRVIEKASAVCSSKLSFSPNYVPPKLEKLQVMGDRSGLTCRDEWLSSLFASVIIALRPKTQIGDTRAVIELLLAAYLKGDVTSAQALGSIVNKMPLDSSHLNLDDVLDMILERSFSGDLSPDVADSGLLKIQCVSGLSWIGKGLLMRGHEKLKDITMILLRCLAVHSELEASTEENGCPEVEEKPLLARSAADAFNVLMSDSEECLNKTFHATVRPLYKQRFFSTVLPILLSDAKKIEFRSKRSILYRAIGHVISNTPLAAVLTEKKKLLPVLLDVITVLSEEICNKDMIYNLLLVFSGLLMDKNGQDIAVENAHVITNCLTGLVSYPHKMLVRETAIQCLIAVSGMPHTRIYPLRMQVLKALTKVLDDPKRSVRQEAVRCRQAWSSMA